MTSRIVDLSRRSFADFGSQRRALAVGAFLSALLGASAALWPAVGLSAAVSSAGGILLVRSDLLRRTFYVLLAGLLFGYAFLGRGFAYLGLPPAYVGEAILAIGCLVLARNALRLRLDAVSLLVLAFMSWGAIRTLPYVGVFGIDALRDGALWGYGFFALAIASAGSADVITGAVTIYRKVLPFFVLWVPLAAVLASAPWLPSFPESPVPVLVFKGGDMGVHLAGVGGFIVVGLLASGTIRRVVADTFIAPAWLFAVATAGALSRGGLVAAVIGSGVAFVLRPTFRLLPAIGVVGLMFGVLFVADPVVDVGANRSLSMDQLTINAVSLFADTGEPGLEGTREWRLAWWRAVVDYTVFGPYFWEGKGFGINLADDDGFQVRPDHSLRAPHNSHITVLARMGVVGLLLWTTLQAALVFKLARAFISAKRRGHRSWMQVDAWLLAYWAGIVVNTSFDPYLEGPQGDIWFWCIVGLALVALRTQDDELIARPRASPTPAN